MEQNSEKLYNQHTLTCPTLLPLPLFAIENNPVVQVPKSEYEAVITELGTPVTAFLTSDDVATYLPEDANIPGDSGVVLTCSVLWLVAMVLVQLLLV